MSPFFCHQTPKPCHQNNSHINPSPRFIKSSKHIRTFFYVAKFYSMSSKKTYPQKSISKTLVYVTKNKLKTPILFPLIFISTPPFFMLSKFLSLNPRGVSFNRPIPHFLCHHFLSSHLRGVSQKKPSHVSPEKKQMIHHTKTSAATQRDVINPLLPMPHSLCCKVIFYNTIFLSSIPRSMSSNLRDPAGQLQFLKVLFHPIRNFTIPGFTQTAAITQTGEGITDDHLNDVFQ